VFSNDVKNAGEGKPTGKNKILVGPPVAGGPNCVGSKIGFWVGGDSKGEKEKKKTCIYCEGWMWVKGVEGTQTGTGKRGHL